MLEISEVAPAETRHVVKIEFNPSQRYRVLHPNERLSCELPVYPNSADFVRTGHSDAMLIRTPDHGDAQVWNIEGTRLGTHVLIRANNLPPELDAALVESAQGYVSRLGSDYGPSHVSPAYGIKKFVA